MQSSNHVRLCQDVHTFGYMCRSNYPSYIKHLKTTVLHIGWTVEGRDLVQLPEQLLAGVTLIHVDVEEPTEAATRDLNAVFDQHSMESGVDTFKIAQEDWVRRGLHREDA